MNKIVYRKGVPTSILYDRKELLRIVKTKDGLVKIDNDYSLKGRSIYLLKDIKHINTVKKKRLIEKGLRLKDNIDHLYNEIIDLLNK